ncbi:MULTISPECIES: class I SAM-dependent methyltransferase [Protofrankia]|uniref:Methyltransferase n=1 Tax=Protofrankia coriariae TaxID=1562887 RepID=A0ABR5F6W2_9ACTN|nr:MULTISPECIES: SAM-dependent methyltransferase [Protofrankia]KLL12473.1 methyltransferase [Protofrankia coriariae]ONH35534.1 methyltransferase [Protofrankia sp. BMG5.30]
MAFYDPVESSFYSWCVERLLSCAQLSPYTAAGVAELGAGTGIPLLEAVGRSETLARVRGFERDPDAFRSARRLTELKGPVNYTVQFGDFFRYASGATERCVVANPPYLPGQPRRPGAPDLYGGARGAEVTCRILGCSFDLVMVMVASISDPLGVLAEATRCGYRVVDWVTRPIRFGPYCRDPEVWRRIQSLAAAGQAFFHQEGYLLAGVTWIRDHSRAYPPGRDSVVLAQVLSAGAAAVPA